MEYREFLENVKAEIKNYLPEEYQEHEVCLHSKYMNGQKLEGIMLLSGGGISPILYLEKFYDDYTKGGSSKEETYASIGQEYQEADLFGKEIPIPDCSHLENYLEQSFLQTVNYERNKSWLQGDPYIVLHDIVFVPYIKISQDAKMRITNSLMTQIDMKKEDLLKYVLENNPKVLQPQFKSIQATLNELMGQQFEEEEYPAMYVLTGKEKKYGASLIANRELMQAIRESLGEDYYILPSSIHETLILPQSNAPSPQELKAMVMEVNRSTVEAEEFLSDNVYKYNESQKAIELAVSDKLRERRR